MLVDLAIQAVRKWFVSETSQQGHPVMQIECLLLVAQVLVEGRNDLNERAHNVREERDTCQHDEYA